MFKVNAHARVEEAPGFLRMSAARRLTLGLFFSIESFQGDQPAMREQEQLALRAQALEFAALWCREVPLRDPSFGDVGQVFDPWVYLGWIGAITRKPEPSRGATA
jgi:alkanesulfonate monooxygenase SsuD/methylene tetrahydromethanopterin reductase-like flavin-dependent oxidoreductase (luciferase family)